MTDPSIQLNQLAQQFLRHFESEAKALEDAHELVGKIREAMIQRDTEAIHTASQSLAQRKKVEDTLVRERLRLKQQMVRVLRLSPDQATVGELVRRTKPPWNKQLAEARRHLRNEARAIRRLNQSNLAIALEMSDVLRRLLEGLTGKSTSARYERTGRINRSDSGSVFGLNY